MRAVRPRECGSIQTAVRSSIPSLFFNGDVPCQRWHSRMMSAPTMFYSSLPGIVTLTLVFTNAHDPGNHGNSGVPSEASAANACAADEVDDRESGCDRVVKRTSMGLTVIVVTSPVRCHPSTEMIERVFSSFALAEGLAGCRVIVVADGVKPPTADGSCVNFYCLLH